MHWLIYVVIAFCLTLSIFFTVKFLKKNATDKNKQLIKEPEKTVEKKEEETEVSPAIFNKDSLLKEFKAKNKDIEKQENYEEFQERNHDKKNVNDKVEQQEEEIQEEVNNLSKALKAILFTDIMKPKN